VVLDLSNVPQGFSFNDAAADNLPIDVQTSRTVQVKMDFAAT
jgi:hypothetical protein